MSKKSVDERDSANEPNEMFTSEEELEEQMHQELMDITKKLKKPASRYHRDESGENRDKSRSGSRKPKN